MTAVPTTQLGSPPALQSAAMFTRGELKAVGAAAVLLTVLGTIVIVGMTIALGHYNSLAHAGPKAAVDGFVLALLMTGSRRWRCVALLGVVYGLVLFVQLGLPYIAAVIVMSGFGAAMVGRIAPNRAIAALFAAIVFELLASLGAPLKILLATDGQEPILWGMWLAEWPLRVVGIVVGVILARRFLQRQPIVSPIGESTILLKNSVEKRVDPAISIVAAVVGATLPMWLTSWRALAVVAVFYLAYGLFAGLRRGLLGAVVAMIWGWAVFALASYLWHGDWHRVTDLGRTLVLRFWPMTIAAAVIAQCVRPIEMFQLLRRLHLPAAVLLPIAHVLRAIPVARRDFSRSVADLRRRRVLTGPMSLLLRPITIAKAVVVPVMSRFANDLTEKSAAADCRSTPFQLDNQ